MRFTGKEAINHINRGGGHTMQHHGNNRITGCLTGAQCHCGARANNGADACEKCVARARYARRKIRRTFEGDA